MTRKFAPMYCRQQAIADMLEEKTRAETLLKKHLQGKAGIVVLGTEDPDWVYCQASFALESGEPYKLVDRFQTIVSNNVLGVLAMAGAPQAIVFVDRVLMARFERHQAFAMVKTRFLLVNEFLAAPPASSIFAGWAGRIIELFGSLLSPQDPLDSIAVARESRLVYATCMRNEQSLSELLLLMFGLHQCCSLDAAQQVLEQRIAKQPGDGVALTALAVLLSEWGEHGAALDVARRAVALPEPAPEALLLLAKECWWAEHGDEGLQMLERLGAGPPDWPRSVRCALQALRGALLALRDEHASAAQAFAAAIDIDGSEYALHLCSAIQLDADGRVVEARAALDSAGVLSPGNPIVQAALCSHLRAHGKAGELQRALVRLCANARGQLEARRFAESAGIAGARAPLPDSFQSIDRDRRHALMASVLPSWFDLCSDSPFPVIMNLYLESAHRAPDDHMKNLSSVFHRLMSDRLDAEAFGAAASMWYLLKRYDIALAWARAALALAPDKEGLHWLFAAIARDAGDGDQAFDTALFAVALGVANDLLKAMYGQLFWSIPRLPDMKEMAMSRDQGGTLASMARERLAHPTYRIGALAALALLGLHGKPPASAEALAHIKNALLLRPDQDSLHQLHVEIAGLQESSQPALLKQAFAQWIAALRRKHAKLPHEAWAILARLSLNKSLVEFAQALALAGLQLFPNDPELLLVQAETLLACGRADEALPVLRALAAGDSSAARQALRVLGKWLQDEGQFDAALASWQRLQALEPDSADGFYGAGVTLYLADREAEALAPFEQAVRLDDDNAAAWAVYARVLRALDQDTAGMQALERALGCTRPFPRALLDLARIHIRAGEADLALARCEATLAVEPGNVNAAIGRMEALGTGRPATALESTLAWIGAGGAGAGDNAPDLADLVTMREAVEDCLGAAAALRVGEAALARYPDEMALLVAQAESLEALGQFADTAAMATRALQIDGENVDALLAYARASAHMPRLEPAHAAALAERLARLATPFALVAAADLLRAAGHDSNAAYQRALDAMAEQAGSQANAQGRWLHHAAWCLLHLGRFDEALARLDEYLEIRPDSSAAVTDRAVIGFIAHDGGGAWPGALADAIATAAADCATTQVKQLSALAPQWVRLGLATASTCDAMLAVVGAAVAETMRR